MLTISRVMHRPALAPVLLRRLPTVSLDWDLRCKSRFEAHDSTGQRLGVFLPRGTVVRGGDVLVAEGGEMVRVQAQAQPLMRVTTCAEHGSPLDLVRAAYHLGNRHVQLELCADHLQFEPDHVLAEMLRGLHLIVNEVSAPFEPEAGAYASGGHRHVAAGAHDHGDGHTHDPHHDHDHGHVHHPGCGHDHGPR